MNVLTDAEVPSSIENNGFVFSSASAGPAEGKWRMAEQKVRQIPSRILSLFWTPIQKNEAEPHTYEEVKLLVSKSQRCGCQCTCTHCQHILNDVWRP